MSPKQKKKSIFLGQQHDSCLKLRMFLFIGVLIHIPLDNYHAFFYTQQDRNGDDDVSGLLLTAEK